MEFNDHWNRGKAFIDLAAAYYKDNPEGAGSLEKFMEWLVKQDRLPELPTSDKRLTDDGRDTIIWRDLKDKAYKILGNIRLGARRPEIFEKHKISPYGIPLGSAKCFSKPLPLVDVISAQTNKRAEHIKERLEQQIRGWKEHNNDLSNEDPTELFIAAEQLIKWVGIATNERRIRLKLASENKEMRQLLSDIKAATDKSSFYLEDDSNGEG
jgi:hypothetical protein